MTAVALLRFRVCTGALPREPGRRGSVAMRGGCFAGAQAGVPLASLPGNYAIAGYIM